MMRRLLVFLLLIFLFSISLRVNGSDDEPDPSYILVDIEPNIVIPGADYPQQDGGSDDRLFQYRSMWLEGYQIINHSEVQKVIKVARDSNINCVTPLINAHYLGTFYNSSFHPRYRDLTWDFDPTMDLIREAHKYNIKVMPWFHTMIDSYALKQHPEWGCVTNTGGRSRSWLNPTLPEVQQYLANVLYQLFRDYPLDGIHLDAIRYPSSTYGYDQYSIDQYHAEGWTDFNAFRREQITECVISIYDSISSIRPYVWIGADIGSSYSGRENSWFQDTDNWSEMGKIDFVTPMIYTLSGASLESRLKDNIDVHSCPVVCGNYIYVPEDPYYGTVPDEATGIAILQNQTERAINAGALGTCFFAYKFMADHPNYHRALREGIFSEKALCPLKKQTNPVTDHEWKFELDQDREGWRTTNMGNYYPYEGVWSVIGITEPTFMSPLLNVTASGLNVVELSMKADTTEGNITIQWSLDNTVFNEENSMTFPLVDTTDWNLYSIHIDRSPFWGGTVRYIRIIPEFSESTNITIDLIRMTWMPDCIKAWAYLGPFFTGDSVDLLHREFIEDETTMMPRLGDVVAGREWRRYFMDRDQVDLRFVLGHVKDAVTYAHVYLISSFEGVVEMRHGNSDGARIWLNGEEVYDHDTVRRAYPDQNVTYVVIKEGINTLLIKQAVYVDDNSFFMRFTAPGNQTLEGLEFYEQLPLLDPPINIGLESEWAPSSDVIVQWEPPLNNTGLDHYEWSLDGREFNSSFGTTILVRDLEDGVHEFTIRCVDDLGFNGEEVSIDLKVDSRAPFITKAVPDTSISLVAYIHWEWKVVYEPISSIVEYLITVENWKHGTSEVHYSTKDMSVQGTEFLLSDNIKDGYRYRITVKAVSGSGNVHTISSDQDVLVDLTPPLKPYGFTMDQTEYGSREYKLSWLESVDNTVGGIEHYEIWWSLNWKKWELHTTTKELNITIKRPIGRSLAVKVRARDISSHYSDFTNALYTENQPPLPTIILPVSLVEGAPILLSSPDIIDPDGDVIIYTWYVDDIPISNMKEVTLTFDHGIYNLRLNVVDDQGIEGVASVEIIVADVDGPMPDSSLSGWLFNTSEKNLVMPDINVEHWNNKTILIDENETSDQGSELKGILMDTLILIIGIPLIFILVIAILFLALGEFIGLQRDEVKEDIIEKKPQHRSEKEKILREFMVEQSVQKALSFDIVRSRIGQQTSRNGLLKTPKVDLPVFKAAPKRSTPVQDVEQWDEIRWDEDPIDDFDEWEEVET